MLLFNYKDIIIARSAQNIMRAAQCSLDAVPKLSEVYRQSANLPAALEFLERSAHVYCRLTPEEEMIVKILSIRSDDINYFPEESAVFVAAAPELAEHHDHFFTFWKHQTLHRGWHQYVEAMVKLIDGQYYHTYSGHIQQGDYVCIGFPGVTPSFPEVGQVIATYESIKTQLGFDPCESWIEDHASKTTDCIHGVYNPETQITETSVLTYSGRIFLNCRPDNKLSLGGQYLKPVN